MRRMTESDALKLLASINNTIDTETIPLSDRRTYELLSRGDTNGIYMMETEWDKYDLLQIKPRNFDELIACVALSHNTVINPYIYLYLKAQTVHPLAYPEYREIPFVKSILSKTHGILIYRQQAQAITHHIQGMSNKEKERYRTAINIILNEIQHRRGTLADYTFFRKRALMCYRMAYIKANYPQALSIPYFGASASSTSCDDLNVPVVE